MHNSSFPGLQRTTKLLSLCLFSLVCSACSFGAREGTSDLALNFRQERHASELTDSEAASLAQSHYAFLRGELAAQAEQYDEALPFYEKAAKLASTPSPTLARKLAQLYLRAGRLADALAAVEGVIATHPEDLELLQVKAGILASQKQVKEAAEIYREIIRRNPAAKEEMYVMLASMYGQAGDFVDAQATIDELLKKDPKSFLAHYYYGRLFEMQSNLPQAESHYRQALTLRSAMPTVMIDLARTLAMQKKVKEAIEAVQQVLALDPDNVTARSMLAQLLLADNRPKEAISEFETVGRLENQPGDTRLKIALIKLQNRDFAGAEVDLNLLLSERPESAVARYYLASVYAATDRPSDAVRELQKFKPGQDYYLESRTLGAYLLRQQKSFVEAVVMLEDANTAKPDDARLLSLLSSMQQEAKLIDSAIRTAKRVVELEPTVDVHYFQLGVLYDVKGDKEQAEELMTKCVELNSKNANALNYLGYSWVEAGENFEQAEEYILRAMAIEKANGYFVDSLGWLYYKQGKLAEARQQLERAVELVPEDAIILEHLGIIYKDLNLLPQALETYRRALRFAPQADDEKAEERIRDEIEKLEEKSQAI